MDIDMIHQLHELEADEEWFRMVGTERRLNHFEDVDFDKYQTNQDCVDRNRTLLLGIRAGLSENNSPDEPVPLRRAWRGHGQKERLRLLTTVYRNYGLRYREIAELLGINASTVRHDLRPFKDGEMIKSDFVINMPRDKVADLKITLGLDNHAKRK